LVATSLIKFPDGTVSDICSISQRGLATYWARLAKDRMPSFQEFDPGQRVHDPKQLAIWNVEAGSGRTVFRALYRGSLLDEAFNEGWKGRTLDDLIPQALLPTMFSGSQECFAKGCAIYMILRTVDGAGHSVDLERLLLPFGEGGKVQQIIASLQLISLTGTADRQKIMSQFNAHLNCVLSVCIPVAGFAAAKQPAHELISRADSLRALNC
jgi:hypothetical protein